MRTRNANYGAEAEAEVENPSSVEAENPSPAAPQGRKRPPSPQSESAPKPKRPKKRGRKRTSQQESPQADEKPRLKKSDLEFDYDRSKLRDPRDTPGRVKRPRYDSADLPDDFKARFTMPKKFPSDPFQDMSACLRKGPDGRPTYDAAGFQLDWKKVVRHMRPVGYNKSSIVNGMARKLEAMEKEEKALFEAFFVDGQPPSERSTECADYIKDQMPKDLGVPWHQIKAKQIKQWEKKGFAKVKASEWWHSPNAEERKRMDKMTEGAAMRKDL